MSRFNRTDGTSPLVSVSEGTPPKVQETTFDFNATKYGSALIGALVPVDVMETNPGEQFDINYNLTLELVNPTVRKMLTGFKVFLHTYYNRWSDLWEGAKNFIDRGRSGKITGSIPSAVGKVSKTGGVTFRTETTGGLYDYLGIPPTRLYTTDNTLSFAAEPEGTTGLVSINNPTDYINALYPMMYQRLWRDKYAPKNLLQNNKNVFPDNEDHFILPYSATGVAVVDYNDPLYGGTWDSNTNEVSEVTETGTTRYNINTTTEKLWIDCIRFRQFNGDIFTTASPFPNMIRGDLPTSNEKLPIRIENDNGEERVINYYRTGYFVAPNGQIVSNGEMGFTNIAGGGTTNSQNYEMYGKLTIDFNLIRALEAYTIFGERMARTNGDYNSMIFAQFGYNPHNETREADYIGGMVMSTGQNTITQTSESGTTPLGTQAGQQLATGGGKYKKFTAPDYGIIMTIMSIVPDTIYTQGIPKRMLCRNQSDVYFPIFNNLGPEAILNKELFVSGTKATDDDVYGYAERGYQYKSRQNEAHGMMRIDHQNATEYASRIFARRFTTTPQLNNRFTEMQPANIDWNIFSTSTDTPFIYTLQSNVFVRRPMPYITLPAGLTPQMA